jgi:hypothetical protein
MLRLRAGLRTPRGLAFLLASTVMASAAAALVAGSWRAWFERHVREIWPPPAPREMCAALPTDEAALRTAIRKMASATRRALYVSWLSQPNSLPPAAPASMFGADAGAFAAWASHTLLHGSPEQRSRAIAFLGASRHPSAFEPLREAAARAENRRETSLMDEARNAIRALEAELSAERTRRRSTTWRGA